MADDSSTSIKKESWSGTINVQKTEVKLEGGMYEKYCRISNKK